MRRSKVLLFDEPLSNVDPRRRIDLRALIRLTVRNHPATTIYVTHDHEEAMALGDRIAVLHRGAVRQVGRPAELYRSPADRFVAEFLGSPPMNFIRGSLEIEGGITTFTDGAGLRIGTPAKSNLPRGEAILGVRPQHLALSGQAGFVPLDTSLSLVQPLAEGADLHVQTARGDLLVVRSTQLATLPPLGPLRLYVDPTRIHLFETGELGRNLMLG